MSILGKIHEVSFYSVLSSIVCLCMGKTTFSTLWDAKFNITSISTFYLVFLFWGSVLFIPIAIIAAFATKYGDEGEGLSFKSNNLFVIIFAHVAEEILGLFLTPFWFLVDFFRKRLGNKGKAIDYITYLIELIFFIGGTLIL